MIITTHAARRLRQRLGIPKRGAVRHASVVFRDGKVLQSLAGGERMLVQYRDWHYIFGYDQAAECPTLITVIPAPALSHRLDN